ncbi:transcriptional regulator PAI 2-type [Kockovaella imperatae]|uniref:Transcriptional regulator PAI 2-type n=1 Tax=Kockovaella imperatae TaxID=4999 RepID=A0A1Y1UF46_9TREE|nr:transcriptional regulator PAI 2-type [Kockovaella imperatae]ORX36638.1 transcriptional regulator PAI 2-type [Kockovaella imperatae]
MHLRHEHAVLDIPTLERFIRDNPLGLFTTSIPHPEHATLQISHIPFILDHADPESSSAGRLRGHIARANPQSKSILDLVRSIGRDELDEEVLIIFNAPVNGYVTPRFYTSTKPTSGKVVPTWDYAAVQVYGKLKVHQASTRESDEFIHQQMLDLNAWGEDTVPGDKWKLSDAPEQYLALRRKAVIGIEIQVTRMEGRFKLSQEREDGDWHGVVEGFKSLGTVQGDRLASMIAGCGKERTINS